MTVYTLRNREPGLLPFNSIHHRYYRADSQVLSFYITAAFFHTVPLTPRSRCLLLGKNITGAQLYLVWRLAPRITQPYSVSLWGLLFVLYYCRILVIFHVLTRAPNKIYIHYHSLRASGSTFSYPDNRRDLTLRRGGITTVYCIKMYSGFIDIHSIG